MYVEMVMAEDAAISEARLSSERHKSLASARKRGDELDDADAADHPVERRRWPPNRDGAEAGADSAIFLPREEARSVRFLVFQGLLAFVFLSNVTTWEGLSE